ncbi:MAG: guanylate kinase [Candidatus Kapaibacterium sp.]
MSADAGDKSHHSSNGEQNEVVENPTGKIVVISAPSGAGKTTIARRLLERHPDWQFSISATTRPKREREVDGVDYFFLTHEEFLHRVEESEMIEWEEIFGRLYGTLKSEVTKLLENPAVRRVLFDIDVKGALSIKRAFPEDAFLIFIAPPSIEELRNRLVHRNTESLQSLERRIERATMEMELQTMFDLSVVNSNLDEAVNKVEEAIESRPGKQ